MTEFLKFVSVMGVSGGLANYRGSGKLGRMKGWPSVRVEGWGYRDLNLYMYCCGDLNFECDLLWGCYCYCIVCVFV